MKNGMIFIAFILFGLITGTAFAHSYQQGPIRIGHIYTYATPMNSPEAAVYVPLLNTGAQDDQLIYAGSDIALSVVLDQPVAVNGATQIQRVLAITLSPNEPVSLRPGGACLMMSGLKRPLIAGQKFPMTLRFAKAGTIKVDVMIEKARTPNMH